MNYRVTTDLYAIPHEDEYLLYAPFQRVAVLANPDAVQLLASLPLANHNGVSDEVAATLEKFEQLGIVNGPQDQCETIDPMVFTPPCDVTLFPTYNCNLRCQYCYATAGDDPINMDWQVAQAAIDFVSANAIDKGYSSFSVGFHGGGEPTLNWGLMVDSVEYARRIAENHGMKTSSTLASNCMLKPDQVEWIASHMSYLNASIDGPAEIQNVQRPSVNGQSSFDKPYAALKQLDELKFPYAIRCTITEDTVTRMSDLVVYFCENFHPEILHFEPLFVCGRCYTSNISAPDLSVYLHEYLRARQLAKQYGVKMHYSGCHIGSIAHDFCGAAGRNFVILPNGYVTSCYEVCRLSDSRADVFIYGEYDADARSFVFDHSRWSLLASRKVQNIPTCADCFLKWHCAGDCLAKTALETGDMFDTLEGRCWLNRELGKTLLIDSVENCGSDAATDLDTELLPC